MTSLKGDLRSIMGTPFGGVGHAVLIFSRVTRAAFNSDSVVLQLHDRIEMPEEANGKFQVDGLDPGPIRIELEGGTVHNHGWNIDLPDEGVWSLTDLVDAQVDWSPAVIGRAEAAAREARDHADRAEAGADRVGTAEQVGVWAGEASASASSAASARSAAQTARNASQSARDAAEGHANRAATSESNAETSETNAKQSEDNAGDYAAVATTAATEAVDAMDSVADIIGAKYATQEYVDDKLSPVERSTHIVGYVNNVHADKYVKLNGEGKLFISTASVVNAGDPANKAYVDQRTSIPAMERSETAATNSEASAIRSENAANDAASYKNASEQNATSTANDRAYVSGQVESIDAAFTDSIPPYLQTSSPTGLGANYQTAIVARRDPATGNVDYSELQECADRARDTGRLLYAEGTVTTDQTLQLECSTNLAGLKYNYTGTGTAVRLGSISKSTTRIISTLPQVYSAAYNPSNQAEPWAVGSVGVEVVNLRGSWVTIPLVQRFHTGIYVHAVGPGPCGYNSFQLGEVWQSWVGMKLYHDTEGYTNENNFFGGRFQSPAGEGHAHIVLDGDTSLQEINSVNNNRFWGVSLEGGGGTGTSGTLVYSVDFGSAAHNIFLDCRFERSPGVRFSSKASRNRIDGGFGTFGLLDTATREEGEQFNEIDSARVKLTNQEQRFRSEYRTHDSVRIVPTRSRIEFGTGTVEPGAYVSASGTRNLSFDALSVHPSSDNATNIGFPGRGWKNAYISGKINLGSLWLRDNAGVLEVGTSESGPWSAIRVVDGHEQ